jgi:hypothetical protein
MALYQAEQDCEKVFEFHGSRNLGSVKIAVYRGSKITFIRMGQEVMTNRMILII